MLEFLFWNTYIDGRSIHTKRGLADPSPDQRHLPLFGNGEVFNDPAKLLNSVLTAFSKDLQPTRIRICIDLLDHLTWNCKKCWIWTEAHVWTKTKAEKRNNGLFNVACWYDNTTFQVHAQMQNIYSKKQQILDSFFSGRTQNFQQWINVLIFSDPYI